MSIPSGFVCGRCGETRWSSDGVCPSCGNEFAAPQPTPPDDGVGCNAVPASRPWLLLLVGGLAAIVIGQLLFSNAGTSGVILPAIVATLLGMALAAAYRALSRTSFDSRPGGESAPSPDDPELFNPADQFTVSRLTASFRQNDIRLLGPVIGLVLVPVLFLRIWGDQGAGWDIVIWLATVAGFASFFALDATVPPRSSPQKTVSRALKRFRIAPLRRSIPRQRLTRDLLPLLVILAIYCAIAVPNLTAWRYSAIGDEYIFYEHARQILDEGISHPFSQNGVYGSHPHFNTIYQSAVITVFSDGHFGWKMTGVVSILIATSGIYTLGYALANRRTAAVAAALFASSHYLLGLANGGYNHLDALPATIWAGAFFVLGLRRGNSFLLYMAGVAIGSGFYFHYSGRIIGPVILLTVLLAMKPRQILGLWPLAIGFLLTVWPTILVAQEQVLTKMLAQSVGGYSEAVSGPVADRLIHNLLANLPAFHFNASSHTYVGGALLDPVSGALATVGIALAIGSAGRFGSKLMLLWLAIAFAATGLLSPYPTTAITRLFPLVAPLALLAAHAVDHLLELVATWIGPSMRRHVFLALLLPWLVAALALNAHQSWQTTHDAYHYTQEALAIGAWRDRMCGDPAAPTMFVGEQPGSTLDLALSSYGRNQPHGNWLIYPTWPADAPLPSPAPACVVLVHPDDPQSRILVDRLQRRYPNGQLFTFTTPSEKSRVEFFRPNEPT